MPIDDEGLKNDIMLYLDYFTEEELLKVVIEAIKEHED